MRRHLLGSVLLGLAAAWLAGLPSSDGRAEGAAPPAAVRIGVVRSLFRDVPESAIAILSQPLKALMESQTGMTGQLQPSDGAFNLGKELQNDQVQLGVFHGFEYAWARQKYPDLKPLVVVVNHPSNFHAYLVVARDGKMGSCADLEGQAVALPRFSREHCHLFLERRCTAGGKTPKEFFAKVTAPSDAEDALDEVFDGRVQAAVVDQPGLDAFKKAKPERFARLRVLQESEPFPAGVIVYHAGALDEKVLRRFREGLLTAHQTVRGKELLALCRLTGFGAVPADFDKQLTAIAKAYPPPSPPK
jgi:ABC-type phosphate/phosphonate transport system substrate-binding protein